MVLGLSARAPTAQVELEGRAGISGRTILISPPFANEFAGCGVRCGCPDGLTVAMVGAAQACGPPSVSHRARAYSRTSARALRGVGIHPGRDVGSAGGAGKRGASARL